MNTRTDLVYWCPNNTTCRIASCQQEEKITQTNATSTSCFVQRLMVCKCHHSNLQYYLCDRCLTTGLVPTMRADEPSLLYRLLLSGQQTLNWKRTNTITFRALVEAR